MHILKKLNKGEININIYFEGKIISCQPLLDVDYEIKEILNILSKVADDTDTLNIKELGESIFNLAASPTCVHGMRSVQIQALANIGSILFSSEPKSISRNHLYEKILLAFFIPERKSENCSP